MPRRSAPSGRRRLHRRALVLAGETAQGPMRSADDLAARLGLPIRDLDLLDQALIHSSYLHEHPRRRAVTTSGSSSSVTPSQPGHRPRRSTAATRRRRGRPVRAPGGDRQRRRPRPARPPDRPRRVPPARRGRGASASGRARPSLLASAFEALVGALYLDLGYDAPATGCSTMAAPELDQRRTVTSLKSPKSRLQEHTQRTTGERPHYRLIDASGPDHEKVFRVEVVVGGAVLGTGEGRSRGSPRRRPRPRPLAALEPCATHDAGVTAPAAAPRPAAPGLQVVRRADRGRVRARDQRGRRAERLGQEQPRRRAALGARRAGPRAPHPARPRT